MSDKLDEMWAALEAHKPAPEYAEAWAEMCRERTYEAAEAAWAAALSAGAAVAAARAAAWAAEVAWATEHYAHKAIDAMLRAREVQPPRIEGYNTNRDQPTFTIKEVKP